MNGVFEDLVAASMSMRAPAASPASSSSAASSGASSWSSYFADLLAGEARGRRARDMFSLLCARARARSGSRFSDADIVDHMIFLMMAAHDTTTSTLTSMTYELAKHPAWQERVRDESRALGKAQLGYERPRRARDRWPGDEGDPAPVPAAAGHPARRRRGLRVRGLPRCRPNTMVVIVADPHPPHGRVVDGAAALRSRALRAGARRAQAAHPPWVPFGGGPHLVPRHALRRDADQSMHAPAGAALPLERARRLHHAGAAGADLEAARRAADRAAAAVARSRAGGACQSAASEYAFQKEETPHAYFHPLLRRPGACSGARRRPRCRL